MNLTSEEIRRLLADRPRLLASIEAQLRDRRHRAQARPRPPESIIPIGPADQPWPGSVQFPAEIASEGNARHAHWRTRHASTKQKRWLVINALRVYALPPLPVTVTLVRIAPRELDAHDNLPMALKAHVDAIASLYCVQDRDKRIRWQYAQEQGEPALRIEIARLHPQEPPCPPIIGGTPS